MDWIRLTGTLGVVVGMNIDGFVEDVVLSVLLLLLLILLAVLVAFGVGVLLFVATGTERIIGTILL